MPIFLRVLRFLLAGTVLLTGGAALAGMTSDTPYTERGKADFDVVLQALNPYGTWSKINNLWAYTPLDHEAPYTDGRWIYTEYGWCWKGRQPHSWATEHYGYWKRGDDKVWSWYPGPYWLPQIVEIRATDTHLGWRSAAVDDEGNFVEKPLDRYSKFDEWTFVTLAQFANPITPSIVAPPNVAKEQLEESTDCRHTYTTYRVIERPGPHPADFADLCRDGGMLAPHTLQDELAMQKPAPAPSTNSYAAHMTGTNAPSLMGVGPEIDPSADPRKVKYWITMSLPTLWTPRPPDAKPEEVYLYRPDFYQDQDGIERRVALWFNPKARVSLKEVLAGGLSGKPGEAASAATPASPAIPAEPATPASSPFASPLDEEYHPRSSPVVSSASSKNPAAPAPAGLIAPQSLPQTNAAPVPAQ